jgi:hypothetical protein
VAYHHGGLVLVTRKKKHISTSAKSINSDYVLSMKITILLHNICASRVYVEKKGKLNA